MAEIARPCVYFDRPGKANTDAVVQTVLQRLALGDLKTVVVASTTGFTALKFSEALQDRGIELISVGETPLIREWGASGPACRPRPSASWSDAASSSPTVSPT